MNTDPKKALTRISLIHANDTGPRVCDPQKLGTPEPLVYSVTHRMFTSLRVADPRSGRLSIRGNSRNSRPTLPAFIRVHPWLKSSVPFSGEIPH
jgi:hypothetical protein